MFTALILLGTGWSILKAKLEEKDKILLTTLIPIQIMASIAELMVLVGDQADIFSLWKRYFIFFDLICGVALLVPVYW